MWDALREKKLGVRILLGVILGVLAISMLLYLVPGQTGSEITNTDVVAKVETNSLPCPTFKTN